MIKIFKSKIEEWWRKEFERCDEQSIWMVRLGMAKYDKNRILSVENLSF